MQARAVILGLTCLLYACQGQPLSPGPVVGSGKPTPTSGQSDSQLSAAPQGQLLYASNAEGPFKVFSLQLPAKTTQSWCPSGQVCSQPAWHPTGQKLVFVAQQGQQFQLLEAHLNQTETQVLHTARQPLGAPQWSADGKQLAFQAGPDGQEQIQRLVPGQPGQPGQPLSQGRYPRWAPQGQALLFLQADQRICKLTPPANNVDCLTPTGQADYYPRWSPDGQQIAYLSRQQDQWELALMQADGSQRRLLLPGQAAQTPAWSPDGQELAFVKPATATAAGNSAPSRDARQQIWLLPLKQPQQAQQLTAGAGDTLPLWSPDGQWLLFQSGRNGTASLFQIRRDGQQEAPLLPQKQTALLAELLLTP